MPFRRKGGNKKRPANPTPTSIARYKSQLGTLEQQLFAARKANNKKLVTELENEIDGLKRFLGQFWQ